MGNQESKWFIVAVVLSAYEVERLFTTEQYKLVAATSADEAYAKAELMGKAYEEEELIREETKKSVRLKYEGISELLPIYEDLEDGCELMFTEYEGLSDRDVRLLVKDMAALIKGL